MESSDSMAFSFLALAYANEDSVEYTYSKYGQLRKQVYEDGLLAISQCIQKPQFI